MTLPETAGLTVTTTLKQARITADTPAQLTITVTNTGETRATNLADTEYCHLFNRPRGKSNPAGLWLYRKQDAPRHGKTCWQEAKPPEETRTYVDIGCGRAQFPSGASITTTYELWDDHATGGYLPPDTYGFDTTIPLWTSIDDETDPTRIDWTFELNVTNPDE